MKLIVIFIGIAGVFGLSAATDGAQAAPRTQASTCSALKAQIEQRGSIIRRHRSRDTQFVRAANFCRTGRRIEWRVVQASDGRCYLKGCTTVQSRGSSR